MCRPVILLMLQRAAVSGSRLRPAALGGQGIAKFAEGVRVRGDARDVALEKLDRLSVVAELK